MMNSAPSYDLAVSVLLTGPRGVGKSTMAKSIATRLGTHLFEVGREYSTNSMNSDFIPLGRLLHSAARK